MNKAYIYTKGGWYSMYHSPFIISVYDFQEFILVNNQQYIEDIYRKIIQYIVITQDQTWITRYKIYTK